ncbi:MAG TPA: ribbon-helix-helix protein, CopG family [Stellaceae bacterium]|nr:ribbon-helix-helix protein, CopG family [Stellaceae bacterium]
MTDTTHITLRAPAEIVEALDRVAAILDRDRSWLMLRAMRQFLDREGREILEDARAIAALDRGESVKFEDALAELDEIIDGADRKKRRRAR